MANKITLTVQHFEGCPNGPLMINNVKSIVSKYPEELEYREQLIETNEDAAKHHFRGSPTLLIDGRDFENMFQPLNPSLTCRFYKNGVPTSEDIEDRIKKMLNH